uniref:Uncharacterized protein n=1 Tax=Timema cristinae TaxID=61476 RepID=A0A7R9GX50_TIMCR|nr:unnamed protein product [Timema cristinae]
MRVVRPIRTSGLVPLVCARAKRLQTLNIVPKRGHHKERRRTSDQHYIWSYGYREEGLTNLTVLAKGYHCATSNHNSKENITSPEHLTNPRIIHYHVPHQRVEDASPEDKIECLG